MKFELELNNKEYIMIQNAIKEAIITAKDYLHKVKHIIGQLATEDAGYVIISGEIHSLEIISKSLEEQYIAIQ